VLAVGVVPARGGSKGIPRKNLAPVAGRPLLAYTAQAARQAKTLQRCLLSTDDPEIAEVGRRCGLEVPFLRPRELASDTARSVDVLLHATTWMDEAWGLRPDLLVLLQPTAPLRTAADIDAAVRLLADSDADSVVSVTRVPAHFSPAWQLRIDEGNILHLLDGQPLSAIVSRRQDLPVTYSRDGALYVVRRRVLLATCSLYGTKTLAYVMPGERAVNIDSWEDLRLAEEKIRAAERDRDEGERSE
jgi:CMP-N-acetylneuraminic acid synthetase